MNKSLFYELALDLVSFYHIELVVLLVCVADRLCVH